MPHGMRSNAPAAFDDSDFLVTHLDLFWEGVSDTLPPNNIQWLMCR